MGDNVCAVIVTYNRSSLLIECLNSLLTQRKKPKAIFIVDNASNDGTPSLLHENNFIVDSTSSQSKLQINVETEAVTVYYKRLIQNTGGAGGFYEGIKEASRLGFDWLWLMDDDVKPEKECLAQLLSHADKDHQVLMPVRFHNSKMLGIEPLTFNLTNPLKSIHGQKVGDVYSYETIPKDGLRIGLVPFEGPLIHNSLIDKIGLPEPSYFIIGDDTDYSIKLNRYTNIKLVPKATMERAASLESGSELTWKDYYYIRNLIYIDRNHASSLVGSLRPFLFLIRKLIKEGLLRRSNKNSSLIMKAYKDGMNGNMGKIVEPGTKI